MSLKKGLIFLIFFSSTLLVSGQKGWEVGPWIGVSNYFGDLNTSFDFSEIGPAGGLIARYNFNNRICTKFGLNYAYIYGDDADSPNSFEARRNLRFGSNIVDLGTQMEFNFLPYIHGSKDYFFTPYLLGGINILYFNPQTRLDDQLYNLRTLGTEGQLEGEEYNIISGGVVFGGGFKWDLNEYWSFNVEIAARKLFTDYIDDVSKTYPNEASIRLRRGEVAATLSDRSEGEKIGIEGRQRGNSRDNDMYTLFGVGLVYYFGKLPCPDLSNTGKW